MKLHGLIWFLRPKVSESFVTSPVYIVLGRLIGDKNLYTPCFKMISPLCLVRLRLLLCAEILKKTNP
ncbi:Putative protein [Zobellia galactanivorans]|uniref:Uncharacterized protein n=1 Tax=Zobellia galactanivorans (strain DSM 12802 / CCUG 47099 / CIP 106680 / NCIMB 13871 / Dsij) TaxID=63186 RepID=G0L1W6_ZOBGA|nr:Putative protein [Zobellia galactanivorans]